MYASLDEAMLACDKDKNCAEINDNTCIGNKLQLCKKGSSEIPSSIGSCVYKLKGTKLYANEIYKV